MAEPLRVAYLLEDTDLSGGVRVVLAQADALIALGHSVTIVTKGMPLTWRPSRAEWKYVDDFMGIDADEFDFVIGTFWTTVRAAHQIAGPRALHLCQGYEGSFAQYAEIKEQIDAVYALPVAKFVVTPTLVEVCRRFHHDVVYIGQIVEDDFFRSSRGEENDPLRVLLVGASQVEVKGIDVGYGALTHARWNRHVFDIVRVSPWAPANHEPLEIVTEFHVALTTQEMVRIVHSCDIALSTSRRTEGFGLPAAEAMAASIPVVMTRIPSFLSFSPRHDYALFGEEDDAEQLGDLLIQLLEDGELRRTIARVGRRTVEQFRASHVAERLERELLTRRDSSVASPDAH